jgi:hypothetical protein
MQRRHVNDRLRMRLHQIYHLPGYCGPRPLVATSLLSAPASNSELSSAIQSLISSRAQFPYGLNNRKG